MAHEPFFLTCDCGLMLTVWDPNQVSPGRCPTCGCSWSADQYGQFRTWAASVPLSAAVEPAPGTVGRPGPPAGEFERFLDELDEERARRAADGLWGGRAWREVLGRFRQVVAEARARNEENHRREHASRRSAGVVYVEGSCGLPDYLSQPGWTEELERFVRHLEQGAPGGTPDATDGVAEGLRPMMFAFPDAVGCYEPMRGAAVYEGGLLVRIEVSVPTPSDPVECDFDRSVRRLRPTFFKPVAQHRSNPEPSPPPTMPLPPPTMILHFPGHHDFASPRQGVAEPLGGSLSSEGVVMELYESGRLIQFSDLGVVRVSRQALWNSRPEKQPSGLFRMSPRYYGGTPPIVRRKGTG